MFVKHESFNHPLFLQQVEHFGSYEMLDVNDKYPYTYMDIGKVMTLIDITKQLLNDPETPTDIHVKAWIGPGTVFLSIYTFHTNPLLLL